jgi:hypothetical protein
MSKFFKQRNDVCTSSDEASSAMSEFKNTLTIEERKDINRSSTVKVEIESIKILIVNDDICQQLMVRQVV